MIVRILGEGQLDVPEGALDALNQLDTALVTAVDANDEEAFREALSALVTEARSVGTPLPDDALVPSDLVLPAQDATLAEVQALLTDEGLIPG